MDTDPSFAPTLAELATLGLRCARVVTDLAELEGRAAAAAAAWLPAKDATPASLEEAKNIGLGIDATEEALAKASPRVATLATCFDRLARATRRTVALARRLETGWPLPRGASVDRRALLLRQATRATRDAIRTRTDGDAEAAERLFADLDARLDEPAFERDLLERPVEEMIQMLCRAIGLGPRTAPAACRQETG